MGKLTKSIEIEASPEEVFNFVNDMEKMDKAHEGFTQAKYTSKGPVGVGTTAHFVMKDNEWDMEITEFVKNKKVTFHTVEASKYKMTMLFTLEPTAKGTKLTHYMDLEIPWLIYKFTVSKNADKEVTQELENIKKALEA